MGSIASSVTPLPITTPTYTSAGTVSTAVTGNDTLDLGTFMHLLTTELANQDPLNPTDDTSFYGQMAQMGELQGMETLNSSSDVQQAQSLMGKTVTAIQPLTTTGTGQSNTVTGVVTQLINTSGNYTLGIQEANGGTAQVSMANIQTVSGVSPISLSSLLGQTVSGQTQAASGSAPTAVSGTVVGISNSTGSPMLMVKTSSGTVAVSPSTVSNIGTATASG